MIIHVLKDGTVLEDIKGHVVKQEEIKSAYDLIDSMNQKRQEEKNG